ncbi:MAG: AP2 domain-containing protein [Pirellulaceae bacterium]
MKKRTNLTRMDHEGCRGWWVRIQRGDKHVSKLFSDGKYGSNRKAELAAIKFRDEELKKLPEREFKGSKGPRRNATGYYLRTRVRRGRDEHAWVAIWTENGRQMEKSFSVNQHGNAGAKKLAKAYRQEMVERMLQQQEDTPTQAENKPVAKMANAKASAARKVASKSGAAKKVAGSNSSPKKIPPKKSAKKSAKRK